MQQTKQCKNNRKVKKWSNSKAWPAAVVVATAIVVTTMPHLTKSFSCGSSSSSLNSKIIKWNGPLHHDLNSATSTTSGLYMSASLSTQ
eukprot:6993966-Ditylum_brightwellii.AAC.1